MSKWFCLECRKDVDTYMDIFKGFSLCCKICGSHRLMKMEPSDKEKFEKFVSDFKRKTGKIT